MIHAADPAIQSISLLKRQINFSYIIDTEKEEIAVKYQVYLANGDVANETPISFIIKKCDKRWQTGNYVNDQFVPDEDVISEGITDNIIQRDAFFSNADKRLRWQPFSIDNAHGKFRFSDDLNAYLVVYKQKIGFLDNSDEIMEEETFIITQIGSEWLTCKVWAENSREIFSSLLTNEIKDYILQVE